MDINLLYICALLGVIVLSSLGGPACSEDCVRSLCKEAGLQHLLHLPVASSPILTIKGRTLLHTQKHTCPIIHNL